VKNHVRTLPREFEGDAAPDSRARSRNQRALAE
jgi:hypothetical protein